MRSTTGPGRQTSVRFVVALVLGLAALLAACSDEAQDQIRDAASQAGGSGEESQAPPPEEPPPETTAAPAQPAPEQPAEDDKFSDEDWVLIIVLGIAALLLIIGATAAATHHSERKDAARAALSGRLREIVGGARWLHDQGSIDILRLNGPEQIRSAWAGVRGSTIDLEGQIAALRSGIDDDALDGSLADLGVRVAALRSSLESYVSLRLDSESSTSLIENATQTVQERRRHLDAALQPVAARR